MVEDGIPTLISLNHLSKHKQIQQTIRQSSSDCLGHTLVTSSVASRVLSGDLWVKGTMALKGKTITQQAKGKQKRFTMLFLVVFNSRFHFRHENIFYSISHRCWLVLFEIYFLNELTNSDLLTISSGRRYNNNSPFEQQA